MLGLVLTVLHLLSLLARSVSRFVAILFHVGQLTTSPWADGSRDRRSLCQPEGGRGDDLFGPEAVFQNRLSIHCIPRVGHCESVVGALGELPPDSLKVL